MVDFSAVCRTCLGTDSLTPIFSQTVDHRRYATDIFKTTGIKVEHNDGLPQQMCTHCVRCINSSLKFRRQCLNSEAKLLKQKQEFHCENTEHTIKFYKEIDIKTNEEVENLKTEDILKIELKCEFEPILDGNNIEIIKSEESDVENDTPLSCLTENNRNDKDISNLLIEKTETKKLQENGKKQRKKEVQRVSCAQCNKVLSARSLRAHVAAQHAAHDRCKYCKLECGTSEALVAHARCCPKKKKRRASESGKQLVKCEVCQKAMQRASLRAHVAVKHKGLGPVCEHCGRRFGNKLRLSEHLRAKHGYEKLRCGHCEFTSASSAALQNHERRHRGEKPFVCETCGAKFHAAYLLAQHRQSHRTDKRVKCVLCGAVFAAAHSLHAHRLARHGALRHRCPLCARAFSCRHYAVKHLRAVHGFKGTVPPLQVDPAPAM